QKDLPEAQIGQGETLVCEHAQKNQIEESELEDTHDDGGGEDVSVNFSSPHLLNILIGKLYLLSYPIYHPKPSQFPSPY
ncbi:hypothetical protein HKBW3S43_01767, partial [Candidatus Hakubella thermalkaliphila]